MLEVLADEYQLIQNILQELASLEEEEEKQKQEDFSFEEEKAS